MKRTITTIDPLTRRPTGPRIVEVQTQDDHPQVPPDCYATSDLPFAAYLRCLGVNLRAIHRQNHKSTLVFDDVDYCLEMARRWANDEDTEVQATVYSREIAKIKTLALRGGF